MKLHQETVMIIGVLVIHFGCESNECGPCLYHEIPGTAKIISVVETEGDTSCDVPAEVRFDFIFDEPLKYELKYLSVWPIVNVSYMIDGYKIPPKRWIESIGFDVGSEHRCIRHQIYQGTCPGAYYSFPDVEERSVQDSCDVWASEES